MYWEKRYTMEDLYDQGFFEPDDIELLQWIAATCEAETGGHATDVLNQLDWTIEAGQLVVRYEYPDAGGEDGCVQ